MAVMEAEQKNWLKLIRDNLPKGASLDDLSIRIDENTADEVQRSVYNLLPVAFDDFYPEVIISFATGYRESTRDYPGKLVAASVISALFERGYACYSDLMTPGGRSWSGYMLRIDSERAPKTKVLVALMTKAFFRSIWCLEEVAFALENNCVILPVRVEATSEKGVDISRDPKSMWPVEVIEAWAQKNGWYGIGEAGMRKLTDLTLARGAATRELMNISSLPAHGTLLNDENVFTDVATRIKEILEMPLKESRRLQPTSSESASKQETHANLPPVVLSPDMDDTGAAEKAEVDRALAADSETIAAFLEASKRRTELLASGKSQFLADIQASIEKGDSNPEVRIGTLIAYQALLFASMAKLGNQPLLLLDGSSPVLGHDQTLLYLDKIWAWLAAIKGLIDALKTNRAAGLSPPSWPRLPSNLSEQADRLGLSRVADWSFLSEYGVAATAAEILATGSSFFYEGTTSPPPIKVDKSLETEAVSLIEDALTQCEAHAPYKMNRLYVKKAKILVQMGRESSAITELQGVLQRYPLSEEIDSVECELKSLLRVKSSASSTSPPQLTLLPLRAVTPTKGICSKDTQVDPETKPSSLIEIAQEIQSTSSDESDDDSSSGVNIDLIATLIETKEKLAHQDQTIAELRASQEHMQEELSALRRDLRAFLGPDVFKTHVASVE